MKKGFQLWWRLLLCLAAANTVSAQSAFYITVQDQENGSALEAVAILVKPVSKEDGRKQEVFFTDEEGKIENKISVPSQIFIQYLGFATFSDTILPQMHYVFYLTKVSIDLQEVVVSGQYDLVTSDQSVYNVQVIDEKQIQAQGAVHLNEVLINQLNYRLSQDNILGSSVSVNGVSGQNVKVMVDGVPLIGRENGNLDLSQINLNNIQRIELIEGPMSVSYGTDALGGIINIITKKSSSYPVELNGNFQYESSGSYNADGMLKLRNRKHSVALSGGRYFFDGFDVTDTSRYQQWKPRLQLFGAVNYQFRAKFFQVSSSCDYYQDETRNSGVPVLSPYSAYAFDDYYFTRRLNESITTEFTLKDNSSIQLTNAHSHYRRIKNSFRKDLVSLENNLLSATGSQDTSVFDAWLFRGTYGNYIPLSKWNYQLGYDIYLQSGKGQQLEEGLQHINDLGAFTSMEYQPVKKLFIRPGIRVSYNSRYGAPVTPSLNIKFDWKKNISLRASYARGFRAPSLKELDLYFVDPNHNIHGNNDLNAEYSHNFQAGVTVNRPLVENNVSIQANGFYNDIRNIIVLALENAATGLYQYVNLDRYKTTGATFQAEYRTKYFSFNTGFTLMGLYNSLSDSFQIESFSMSPEFQNNFYLTFPKAGLEGAVFFKSVGTTPAYALDSDGELYQTFIEPYTLVDISLTKNFFSKRIAFSFGAKNLFNVINIQTTSLSGAVHTSEGGSMPFAMGRYFFTALKVTLYKE